MDPPRPHPDWPLVVAYGLGVNSTAMLVEFVRREIKPDLILFADTGGEKPETYQYLPVIDAYLKEVKFPPVVTVRYEPKAVRDVILELLTNPELRTLIAGLAPAAPPAVAPEPSTTPTAPPAETAPAKSEFWGRVKETCKNVKDATVRKCRAAKTAVVSTVRTLSAVMPLKKMLLVGAGVGVAVATVSYVCPHTVSAAVSGVCGAATAVAVQVGRWFRRSAGLFGFGGKG